MKRSSDLRDPGPWSRRIFALLKPGLFTGSYDRGYYGAMVMEAARTVFRGMGVNPNAGAEPVQGTLERWLHWTGQWGGGPA